MKEKILHSIHEGTSTLQQLTRPDALHFIEYSSTLVASCFRQGNKLLIAGNGGSLCDAAHFAEELTGFFRRPRPALPAIALSEPGHLTCVGNDLGYDQIFARALEALGKPGDIFIGLTTSGNSSNIIEAFKTAQQRGLHTIAFLGKGGGKLRGFADAELLIEGVTSDRIQETHMAAIHIIIEMVENLLFYQQEEESAQDLLVAAAFQ